jgi:hypothetical protein
VSNEHACRYDATVSTTQIFLNMQTISPLLQTCVPLSMKESITNENYASAIAESFLYRRNPVDCAALSANAITMQRPEIRGMFQAGGMCDFATGSRLVYVSTDDTENSIASATNARFFSGWYGLMSGFDSTNDGFIFFDTSAPLDYTSFGFDIRDNTLWDVGGIPTCQGNVQTFVFIRP